MKTKIKSKKRKVSKSKFKLSSKVKNNATKGLSQKALAEKFVAVNGLSPSLIKKFEKQMKNENFPGTIEDFILKIAEFGTKVKKSKALIIPFLPLLLPF